MEDEDKILFPQPRNISHLHGKLCKRRVNDKVNDEMAPPKKKAKREVNKRSRKTRPSDRSQSVVSQEENADDLFEVKEEPISSMELVFSSQETNPSSQETNEEMCEAPIVTLPASVFVVQPVDMDDALKRSEEMWLESEREERALVELENPPRMDVPGANKEEMMLSQEQGDNSSSLVRLPSSTSSSQETNKNGDATFNFLIESVRSESQVSDTLFLSQLVLCLALVQEESAEVATLRQTVEDLKTQKMEQRRRLLDLASEKEDLSCEVSELKLKKSRCEAHSRQLEAENANLKARLESSREDYVAEIEVSVSLMKAKNEVPSSILAFRLSKAIWR